MAVLTRLGVVFACALAACSGGGGGEPTSPPTTNETTELQIVAVSTWLGQLDPLQEKDASGNSHEYAGLGVLSAYFKADRAKNPNTLTLMTADSFGASPPLSAFFKDEPAIKAMNFLGVTGDTLGNHNFNNGIPALNTLVDEAQFPFVVSNLANIGELNPKVVSPYKLVDVAGVKVALLGVVDPLAPTKTLPGRFGAITIKEPISAANNAAAEARAAGAQVVIAMTDQETTTADVSGTRAGPLIDFAQGISGVDVTLGYKAADPAATHIGSTLVVENMVKGRTYARVSIKVQKGVVIATSGEVVVPDKAKVTPDPAAEELLAPYRAQLAKVYDEKIATTDGVFERDGTAERLAEVPIGDLVADSMLEKYRSIGVQIALMNSGGIRSSIPSSQLPLDQTLRRPAAGYASGPPFDVVVGDVYTVLPFGNQCVVRTVTGATLRAALEHSVSQIPNVATRFLQIAGVKMVYKESAPPGARIQSVTLDDGTPILADKTEYKIVLPSIISLGTDQFSMFAETSPTPGREVMADVLLEYIRTKGSLSPTTSGRITRLP